MCIGGANMVSEELKNVLESFIQPDNDDVEFLPVKENTVYVPGTDSIIKVRVDYNKVKELKIFNSQPVINDIIVSKEVYKAIKKDKLDSGLNLCLYTV